jgi:hypothetical protein
LTVSTIVLPTVQNIPPAPVAEIKATEQPRLARELLAYALIHEKNLFEEYQPPVVEPPAPVEAVKASEKKSEEVKESPKPPPSERAVVSTMAFDGKLFADVQDLDKPANPLTRVTLNETMDDGKVVLIHPKGVVVRVGNGRGNGGFKDFLYKLGRPFKEREELSAEKHPEIHHELLRAIGS